MFYVLSKILGNPSYHAKHLLSIEQFDGLFGLGSMAAVTEDFQSSMKFKV
jgi:hypothetical protein